MSRLKISYPNKWTVLTENSRPKNGYQAKIQTQKWHKHLWFVSTRTDDDNFKRLQMQNVSAKNTALKRTALKRTAIIFIDKFVEFSIFSARMLQIIPNKS